VKSLETNIGEHVSRLRHLSSSTSVDVERLISKVDKKMKSLSSEDHARAKEKLLRDILAKY